MIGDRYNIDTWNCTHEVAQWYNLNGYGDIVVPINDIGWSMAFLWLVRKGFKRIQQPEQAALVTMQHKFGGLHIGVWDRDMIHHCFEPCSGHGQTIRSPLSMLRSNYKDFKYWRPVKHD